MHRDLQEEEEEEFRKVLSHQCWDSYTLLIVNTHVHQQLPAVEEKEEEEEEF
jgi:hypothetical protein